MAMKIPNQPRYRKRVGAFSGIDVKHDESVIDFSTAASCYNFDFSSGALRGGYGIKQHDSVPQDAVKYWVYRFYSEEQGKYVDQFIYQGRTGWIYFYDFAVGKVKVLSGMLYTDTDAINYRLNSQDVLLISSAAGGLSYYNGKYITHCDSPRISSMALHFERLFVISPQEPTRVYFSDDLDPTNWKTEAGSGGFIELLDERGNMLKVVSFANYLYIFREHGISRITAAGDESGFSVTDLYVSTGRIYSSSIVQCGGFIMFAATDGIYMFDGYETTRVLKNVDGLIAGEPKASAYFNGRYYLSAPLDFSDGETVGCESGDYTCNGLIVYCPATGDYSVTRGTDISFMNVCSVDGEDFLMACDSLGAGVIDRCGARLGEPLKKHWQGPYTDFGSPDRIKTVREIYMDADCECTVGIRGKKQKSFYLKKGKRRIRVNVNNQKIALSVDAEADDVRIAPPTLVYSVH